MASTAANNLGFDDPGVFSLQSRKQIQGNLEKLLKDSRENARKSEELSRKIRKIIPDFDVSKPITERMMEYMIPCVDYKFGGALVHKIPGTDDLLFLVKFVEDNPMKLESNSELEIWVYQGSVSSGEQSAYDNEKEVCLVSEGEMHEFKGPIGSILYMRVMFP